MGQKCGTLGFPYPSTLDFLWVFSGKKIYMTSSLIFFVFIFKLREVIYIILFAQEQLYVMLMAVILL